MDITGFCSGGTHSCALKSDGTVKCFGNNASGKLGLGEAVGLHRGDAAGEMGESLPPVQLGTGVTPVEVVCGGAHTCARFADGKSKCWGSNGSGRLVVAQPTSRSYGATPSPSVGGMGDALPFTRWPNTRNVKKIVAGASHICALLQDGIENDIKCGGEGASGQLGYGFDGDDSGSEKSSDEGSDWGDNNNTVDEYLKEVSMGTAVYPEDVFADASANHNCAILSNESLKCWGLNDQGQLGLGNTKSRGIRKSQMGNSLPPVNLGASRKAVQVSLGKGHTCVLANDDSALCWGNGAYGMLGRADTLKIGDSAAEMGTALVPMILGVGKKAVQLSLGLEFSCALLNNNGVKCFGRNSFGQLGQGIPTTETLGDHDDFVGDLVNPIDFGTNLPIQSVHTGSEHACVVFDTGPYVKCWGRNDNGQLGLGLNQPQGDSPIEMGGNLPFTYIFETTAPSAAPTHPGDTERPSQNPTSMSPTVKPATRRPTTKSPTKNPTTASPTLPTESPTTRSPTTKSPTEPTRSPTTKSPTEPTESPTTRSPTTKSPTEPTRSPTTKSPTEPTESPSKKPTIPTKSPTTKSPTEPTQSPSIKPTVPTEEPTTPAPTEPTLQPTRSPTTSNPTRNPTTGAPAVAFVPVSLSPTPAPTELGASNQGQSGMIVGTAVGVPLVVAAFAFLLFARRKRQNTARGNVINAGALSVGLKGALVANEIGSRKRYAAFLSHMKKEAGPTATLMSIELAAALKTRGVEDYEVLIDNIHMKDLRSLPNQVKESKVLVAMLSKSYLTRPWCLAELHYALEFGVPILALKVNDAGYNFEDSKEFLEHLSPETLDVANPGASKEMARLGIDVTQLGRKLFVVLPSSVALEFSPNSHPDIRRVQLDVVVKELIRMENAMQTQNDGAAAASV